MSYRPGELLQRGGAVTAETLRKALDHRTSHGGSLGESLIALNAIDEHALVDFYQKKLVLPRLEESRLEKIPAAVLELVPPELAAEFRVVPLSVDGEGSLTLAMADPSDNHAVEEIAFFVDKFILRVVGTESAIRAAIQKHYGLLRPPAPDFDVPVFIGEEKTAPEPVVVLTKKKTVAPEPAPEPPPPEEPVVLSKKSRERMDTLPGMQPRKVPAPVASLREAMDRDEVGRLLLDFAATALGRAALFVMRNGSLTGFDVRGQNLDAAKIAMLEVPLNRPSLFEAVTKSRLPFRGPLPDSAQDKALARALSIADRSDVLVWPVLVRDRVVAVLFGDALGAHLPEAELQSTLHEAGRAYERILLSARNAQTK